MRRQLPTICSLQLPLRLLPLLFGFRVPLEERFPLNGGKSHYLIWTREVLFVIGKNLDEKLPVIDVNEAINAVVSVFHLSLVLVRASPYPPHSLLVVGIEKPNARGFDAARHRRIVDDPIQKVVQGQYHIRIGGSSCFSDPLPSDRGETPVQSFPVGLCSP